MKKALVWIRDHIFAGVIVAILTAWLAPLSLEGLLSTAAQSWRSMGNWTVDPVAVPRWQLLIVLGVGAAYAIGLLVFVVRTRTRTEKAISVAFTGIADAFNKVADEIGPKATSLPDDGGAQGIELNPGQISVLEYLARRYSAGKTHAAPREIARAIGLPLLRTEQLLDQLLRLGMIRQALSMITGTTYVLDINGREWLLANGYE